MSNSNGMTGAAFVISFCVLSFSFDAHSQTCASPLPIRSNAQSVGNTCSASNSLPSYGLIASPQNEIVYSFVAVSANAMFSLSANTFGGVMYLMPSPCASFTDIIAAGNQSSPMPVTGLVDGQTYYVIVSAESGGPASACGSFVMANIGPIPVELTNFSVE